MVRKKVDSDGAATGDLDASGERPSRLGAAITRILASARGATEGRRNVRPSDLVPPRSGSSSSPKPDDDGHDAASHVEWTLRMMQ